MPGVYTPAALRASIALAHDAWVNVYTLKYRSVLAELMADCMCASVLSVGLKYNSTVLPPMLKKCLPRSLLNGPNLAVTGFGAVPVSPHII